jgi:hypothetical protein
LEDFYCQDCSFVKISKIFVGMWFYKQFVWMISIQKGFSEDHWGIGGRIKRKMAEEQS